MALPTILIDTFDPNLDLKDSSGKPILLTIDIIPYTDGDFSVSRLLEDQPAATPILVKK